MRLETGVYKQQYATAAAPSTSLRDKRRTSLTERPSDVKSTPLFTHHTQGNNPLYPLKLLLTLSKLTVLFLNATHVNSVTQRNCSSTVHTGRTASESWFLGKDGAFMPVLKAVTGCAVQEPWGLWVIFAQGQFLLWMLINTISGSERLMFVWVLQVVYALLS